VPSLHTPCNTTKYQLRPKFYTHNNINDHYLRWNQPETHIEHCNTDNIEIWTDGSLKNKTQLGAAFTTETGPNKIECYQTLLVKPPSDKNSSSTKPELYAIFRALTICNPTQVITIKKQTLNQQLTVF
jgi:hypothetical protein